MKNYFIKKYGKVVVYFLFIIFLLTPNLSFAISQCSKDGYTVLTINGVLTNESGAIENRDKLKDHLPNNYKNEPVNINYLLNPSHMAGLLDFTDALGQGFFNVSSDYDLTEMMKDASNKITTQKVLLVGHSQGNFYANNLYSKVAGIDGGIPKESVRVYSIGTPANNVAGKFTILKEDYITSDTDKAIAGVAGTVFSILPANVHIDLQKGDDFWGHDFSKVYLKYKADEIVSNIQLSLDKLKTNDIQNENSLCVNPPVITLGHKIQGAVLAFADHPINVTIAGIDYAGLAIGNGVITIAKTLGSSISSLARLIVHDSKNLTASIGGLNIGGNVINALDDSTNTPQNTDPNTNKDTTETTPPSDVGDPMVVESPQTTPPNTQVGPVYSGADTGATGQNNSSTQSESSVSATEIKLASSLQNLYKDLLPGGGGGGPGAELSVCVAPKILNATGDACVDSVPVCVAQQTLVNNVCVDPPSPPAPALVTTTIDKNTTLTSGEYTYDYLVITNNAILYLQGDPASSKPFKGVKINAVNITIDSGSSISADGTGYVANEGPGASSESFVGASYGGFSHSGVTYSKTYGSATKPTDLGSGGTYYGVDRSGGGAVYLAVSDTFTNNGIISANGFPSSSGGSVYVTAKNIAGGGAVRANGGALYGNGFLKSPGGGGRVALYYQTFSFSGTIEAKGGCGQYDGMTMTCASDGTVGVFDIINNDLYVNSSWKFIQADAPFNFNNIYISNGAKVTSENGVTITANNILVNKNSSFVLADNQVLNIPSITIDGGSTLTLSGSETINANNLTVTGNNSKIDIVPLKILSLNIPNITIGVGAFISADNKGYGPGVGPGSPTTTYDPNNVTVYYAGASYGGKGGIYAKPIYGSKIMPTDFGSGGNGNYVHGGGVIRLISTGNFINNGIISANGDVTSSGGSIYVTANTLDGTGVFRANGGGIFCPASCYWPGGGGRIALYYNTLSFVGTTVSGGASGNGITSADGTVYIASQSAPLPSSAKQITSFNINSLNPNVVGVVNETNHTIALSVPFDTEVSSLNSIVLVSVGASISPESNTGQNFITPITYIVTAEDGSTQDYVATVTIEPDPNAPSLVSASVASATTVDLIFSEDLDGRTITNKDFTITGHTLLDSADAGEITPGVVRLTITDTFATGEIPQIIYNTTVSSGVKTLKTKYTVPAKTIIATNSF